MCIRDRYAKAYAYEIHATKSWNRKEVAYEDIFDSYTMDLNTFKAGMNARPVSYTHLPYTFLNAFDTSSKYLLPYSQVSSFVQKSKLKDSVQSSVTLT